MLLFSPDAATAQAAIASASAATHRPELLAVALRHQSKAARDAARAALVNTGDPALVAFLQGQKSAERASSPEKIGKLMRAVDAAGVTDITRFGQGVLRLAAPDAESGIVGEILLGVLRLKGAPTRPWFSAVAEVRDIHIENISGALPDGLDELRALTELWLRGKILKKSDHMDQLAGLPAFVALNSGLPVPDLRVYSAIMPRIRFLSFEGQASELTDISALAGWGNLETLRLPHTGVQTIAPLGGLERLWRLDISDTKVTELAPLRGHPAMRELNLRRLAIPDLSPLSTMPALEQVYLDSMAVGDLAVLRGCARLTTVSLWGSQFSNMAALAELPRLTHLHFLYVEVPDLDALQRAPALRYLKLINTRHDPAALERLRAAKPDLVIAT